MVTTVGDSRVMALAQRKSERTAGGSGRRGDGCVEGRGIW